MPRMGKMSNKKREEGKRGEMRKSFVLQEEVTQIRR